MALTQHLKDQIFRAHAEEYVDVRNSSGSPIAASTFVKPSGDYSTGGIPSVVAVSTVYDYPVGFLLTSLPNNNNTSHPSSTTRALRRGRVQVTGFNTTGASIGAPVYFTAAGNLTLTALSAPVGIVLSASANGVVYLDLRPYAHVRGSENISANSVARTTTTSSTYQTKVTLVTGDLLTTAVYRLDFSCVLDSVMANREINFRIYNNTNAIVLYEATDIRVPVANGRSPVGGFVELTFTTAATRTLLMQWNSDNNFSTIGIAYAYLDFYRIR